MTIQELLAESDEAEENVAADETPADETPADETPISAEIMMKEFQLHLAEEEARGQALVAAAKTTAEKVAAEILRRREAAHLAQKSGKN